MPAPACGDVFVDDIFQDCDEGSKREASRAGKRSRASSSSGGKKNEANAADLVGLGKPAATKEARRAYTWDMKFQAT
ncbi:hypothetical protein N9L68_09315, partial [bacterium]|nr:hypothetical protein [bacterium]